MTDQAVTERLDTIIRQNDIQIRLLNRLVQYEEEAEEALQQEEDEEEMPTEEDFEEEFEKEDKENKTKTKQKIRLEN